MSHFVDSRLESPALVDDVRLRWLAGTGARIRAMGLREPVGAMLRIDRPRGVLILGPEARLIRSVLEPVCPVPFMAWTGPTLPAWVGPLDLVVIVDDQDPSSGLLDAGIEAQRRGATIVIAAAEHSELAQVTASADTTVIPADEVDPTAAAVALVAQLGRIGIGPHINLELVADAADLVAEACSPIRDLATNPGKELAIALADRLPLVWGGTVLASRAGRRLCEAVRRASHMPALAADDGELLAVLCGKTPKDPFADPDEDTDLRPVVVLFDADKAPPPFEQRVAALTRQAEFAGVRVTHISSGRPDPTRSDVESYVTLLLRALYGAEYLRIGLGR